ncbi:hypothetical protein KVR01_001371 [Diaporthe batatas]|uniref:uncharacterized protein n=1 Tax=Diaporthe batatas TaxID=748121 RepID=UPI001D05B253|nr:uncharacterized protein KVR01_001371 [Diaporthe batatas]KAG8168622.1 hypothetical protein KVR01_001371 [Diaporthe batatas]
MAVQPQLSEIAERASATDRIPRTHTNMQYESESLPARPPPVHETSSDARSWSRQTEDALDVYKRRADKHKTSIDQFIRLDVAEYRLDSGNNGVLVESFPIQPNQMSENPASNKYHATSVEVAQVEPEAGRETGNQNSQPKNHRMTKMIAKEDIDFFTALLEGHDPPTMTSETETFVHEETETRRKGQETSERDANLRRLEEAQAAKEDSDFFMMLMQKD